MAIACVTASSTNRLACAAESVGRIEESRSLEFIRGRELSQGLVSPAWSAWHTDEDDLLFFDLVVVVEQMQPGAVPGERPEGGPVHLRGQLDQCVPFVTDAGLDL